MNFGRSRRGRGRGYSAAHGSRGEGAPAPPAPPPASPDMVRFVCISDTHGRTLQHPLPEGDVLLHAGDFTRRGTLSEVMQFNAWLGSLPHRHKVVIAGNHEESLDSRLSEMPSHPARVLSNAIFLCDETVTLYGIRIYGTPWIPEYHSPLETSSDRWKAEKYPHLRAFELPKGVALHEKWAAIPEDTDILMTHTPPEGHCDLTRRKKRAGCRDLLQTVQGRIRPKYHVFGHIHEGYGMSKDGHTVYINASICDSRYQAVNAPFVFDLPLVKGETKQVPKNDSLDYRRRNIDPGALQVNGS